MKLTCINAVHAGTYDNPACRNCNCEREPAPIKTRCRLCRSDRILRYHGLCDGCYARYLAREVTV